MHAGAIKVPTVELSRKTGVASVLLRFTPAAMAFTPIGLCVEGCLGN